ncbi:phage baseplate plug protein [Weissella sp. MSCH1]|uniref:phage baseplate plug family protein n=1 Tax=Weissella sp. MSCH1 TaxID=3383343 RepID=UPI003896A90E
MTKRSYIPVNKNGLPEMFEFPFGNLTYILGIDYLISEDIFTVDLKTAAGEPIVLGERLVANQPLWSDFTDSRIPSVTVVPMNEADPNEDITFETFGDTVQLFIDDVGPDGG